MPARITLDRGGSAEGNQQGNQSADGHDWGMAELARHSTVTGAYGGSTPPPPAPPARRSSSGRGRRDSVALGALSEVEAIAALCRAGYRVSKPVVEHGPYDCVIDDGAQLQRVQIKTGWVDDTVVRWATCSNTYSRAGARPTRRTYVGVCDLFAVWVPETRACYLVPVDECGGRDASLRLVVPTRGRQETYRMAARYAVED